MALIIVNHRVKDYDAWRPFFDDDLTRRKAAGITTEKVYRSSEDPNDLYLLFTTDNPEKMGEMMEDPELRKVMDEAGVISQPTATVLVEAPLMEHV